MSKIWLYAHGGSGNHGCEAIVRSTYHILSEESKVDLTLISSNPEEDKRYGLDHLCAIEPDILPYKKNSLSFAKAYLSLKIKNDYVPLDKMNYKTTVDHIRKGDIAMSIGGDNYCYADVNKYIMLHDMMLERGANTVLWGCSVEPELLEQHEICADISRYHLIAARETITYNALKAVNQNTVLVADPAFTLLPEKTDLPQGFVPGNTVGINISPMIQKSETIEGITLKNYELLIEEILRITDMTVALIPHVVWPDGDDRKVLSQLYERFKDSGRVVLIEDQSCSKLKHIISQCRFFVGARTHATIAAYSSCVPTLVVGYSVKARGIARDLFGNEEHYVLPVQSLKDETDLTEVFDWIVQNEDSIKRQLENEMPVVIKKAESAGEYIERLI
ncbi:MAG: polysaccharide pyruvyl transferase family protein [Acutalibacteraceae bacterium]